MPMSDIVKSSEGVKKKILTDTTADSVVRKRSGPLKGTPDDNKSRGDEGALVPVKPARKQLKKLTNDISDKRNKTLINDKTPKKTVQRAKGSMSLNKTVIDKTEDEKKKRLSETDGVTPKSSVTMKENESVKVKAIRSKVRQSEKLKVAPNVRTIPAVKKKNWATVVKKESTSSEKEEEQLQSQQLQLVKEVKDANEEEPEANKTGQIQTEGVPFTTCSFFEKIQQGVRAYFASRNSFSDDKPKKKVIEGIRTGAGVAKGGKEETNARIQQNKKKNKIKYSDSDLFYDRQRLKSNSGGQTNIFLNKNPNLLRNLQYITFKKLNHPKKHYVTIQIAPKGYFYRSLELRPNQSARGLDNRRLESASLPTKSEIQIARMASTSSKGSHIHKKRIKKSKKKITQEIQMKDKFHSRLKATNFLLNKDKIAQNFETEDNFQALKSPNEEGLSFLTGEKTEEFNSEQNDPELEKMLNLITGPMKAQNYRQIEIEEPHSALDGKDTRPQCEPSKNSTTKFNLVPSFHTLMNYLKDSFDEEQIYGDLEVSPVSASSFHSIIKSPCNFEKISEPVPTVTNPLRTNVLNISENNFCVATALCEFTKNDLVEPKKSEEHYAGLIIGDIDLHSEFQNYLKESNSGKNDFTGKINSALQKEKSCLSNTHFDSNEFSANQVNSEQMFENNSNESTEENKATRAVNEGVKAEPEIESKILPKEETNDGVKCTFERSHYPQRDIRGKCAPRVLSLLFKVHRESSRNDLDCYEKVSPMKTTIDEEKCKNELPLCDTSESVPVENDLQNSNENTESEKNENSDGDKTTKMEPGPALNQTEMDPKWSPTMDKLGEIFTSIRRQIKKLEKKSKNSKNSWASSIISLLNEKLQDKNQELDLINFSKSLKECLKPPPVSGPIADKNQCKKLEAYVNTFQEILMSSLSFEQITYLNKVVSQQDNIHLEESDQCSQDETVPDAIKLPLVDEIHSENENQNSLAAGFPDDTKPENLEPSEENSESVEPPSCDPTSTKEEENQEKEISPATEFQAVLKSSPKTGKKPVDKIFVNVKICGSQILVSDFSYTQDAGPIKSSSPRGKNDSELILENLSKKTNSTKQRISPSKKFSKKPTKKSDSIKIVLKSRKAENQKSTIPNKTKLKNFLSKLSESSEEEDTDEENSTKTPEKSKDVDSVRTLFVDYCLPLLDNNKIFEYNQELLKVQHPIDAIIETSESKIIETEKLDDCSKSRPPLKTFRTGLKESLNEAASGKVFFKYLNCDLPRKNDELQKSLSAQDLKKSHKNTHSSDVKSLNGLELKIKSEKKKKVLGRQHKYFNYPFKLETTVKSEEEPQEEDWQELTNDKHMDEKGIQRTSSKTVKKSESTVTRKGMRSASVRLIKQDSLKDVKTNALRSGRKKPNRPTLASQLAAAERLSRRPARFLNSDPVRPKPKEKIAPPVKSVEKVINITTPLENSADFLLFFNATDSPDFWSETSSVNTNTEEVIRNKQKSQLENSPAVMSNTETLESTAKHKNSPIVIFSTQNHDDDVISQFAIIRSESVLKTLSRSLTPQNQPDTVLKSRSDLKFYPGRVTDTSESAEPWVTFVLTPQQQEKAKLPSNQVQIVDKSQVDEKEKSNEQATDESVTKTLSLGSIEKFIEILKENRLRANNQLNKFQKFRHERSNLLTSEILQKQKLKWTNNSKTLNKNKFNRTKSNSEEKLKCEKKFSRSEFVLAKVVLGVLQYLLDRKEGGKKDFDEASDLETKSEDGGCGKWREMEETMSEMLDWVIKSVTEYEKLVKKTKLLIAIKSELQKKAGNPKSNLRGLMRLSRKLKTLKSLQKVKIEAPKSTRGMSAETVTASPKINETESFSNGKQVIDLEHKSSVYFDAEETPTGKMENFLEQLQHQSGEPAAGDVVLEPPKGCKPENIEAENRKTETALTSSDEALLSNDPITIEIEERIFIKMHENLEKNNAAYSVALFDALLSKKVTLSKEKQLGDVLENVEEKTKKLMVEMEKRAWLKLHHLLEEVLQQYSLQPEEKTAVIPSSHFSMKRLNQTLGFLNSIQAIKNKMAAFYTFLNPLSKFSIRRSKFRKTVNPKFANLFRDEPFRNNSGYEIHAAKAVHNLCTDDEGTEKETHLQILKNQIRDQRVFLEYLIKNGSCSHCSEVNDVKNKVSEKIMALVKSMSEVEDVTQTPKETQKESKVTFSLNHVGKFLRYRSLGTTKPADVFGM